MAQLNQMQRYAISLYLKEKKTQAYIAGQLNVSESTISRELKRNGGKRGYSWRQAQELCDMRKERLREPRKMCGQVKRRIEKYMRDDQLSPEQIVGLCRNQGLLMVGKSSTLFSIIRNLPNGKVAADVAKVTVDALLPFKRGNGVKTITTDNGTEFYEHEYISKKLGAPVFFTNPYCSWEKGCIENTNMLYRQYLPRDPSFALWTDEKLLELQHKLNRRPRKKSALTCRIESFIYLCNHKLRFGLESIAANELSEINDRKNNIFSRFFQMICNKFA